MKEKTAPLRYNEQKKTSGIDKIPSDLASRFSFCRQNPNYGCLIEEPLNYQVLTSTGGYAVL